jgi:hypothetical protein
MEGRVKHWQELDFKWLPKSRNRPPTYSVKGLGLTSAKQPWAGGRQERRIAGRLEGRKEGRKEGRNTESVGGLRAHILLAAAQIKK